MLGDLLYNGLDFPEYIFTDMVKSHLFVDFDMVFMDEEFWKIMKLFLASNDVGKIIVENLDPDYLFRAEIDVAGLPGGFLKIVRTANLRGYFPVEASLHMITIKTLIFPADNSEVFRLVLDRNYSVGIIGFSMPTKPLVFSEYEIQNLLEDLKVNFAGKELPVDLKNELYKNWKLSST